MKLSFVFRSVALAAVFLTAGSAHPENAVITPPADAQAAADAIAREIEQIRGLTFKQPVRVESQSVASFGEYVSRELDKEVPEVLRAHYGAIVRTLGLYRGPPIEDFSSMMTTVMTSQVGAYYDPEKQSFFVVMGGMSELMQGVLYSHELYHALQDQYFGLVRYMDKDRKDGAGPRNADSKLARSAVVEGEATYMMSIWMMQKMSHKPPTRKAMAKIIELQANVGLEQLREALKQPKVAEMVGAEMQRSVAAADEIPSFIMDSMMAVYLKGAAFVFAVQDQGWPAVEKLYGEYPPQSTEQILHPEKWLAREAPTAFKWPRLDKIAALKEWELLDDDVLGEFLWRSVFKEQGFAKEADSAAAGWGGDRYAVFKRKDSKDTLLLLRTRWDSEADAREFSELYGRVLAVKYADAPVPTRLVRKGVDVFVVEGGDEARIDALLKVVKRVKPKRT
ncbi:MAG TPA: hypothetical protein VMS40_18870 [Vicinamibacterales bacterium]|nr:hypothetical protein [Vicinamibacterales bacterium]